MGSKRKPLQTPVYAHEVGCYAVPLTQGQFALIDEIDIPTIAPYRWRAQNAYGVKDKWYAIGKNSGKWILMHRLIMMSVVPELNSDVDHRNTNSLDNRRDNLRQCSRTENARNKSIRRGKKYKGVFVGRYGKRWQALIVINKKGKYLGTFDTQEEAALVYNKAAIEYFGEFARLNIISDQSSTAIEPAGQ